MNKHVGIKKHQLKNVIMAVIARLNTILVLMELIASNEIQTVNK